MNKKFILILYVILILFGYIASELIYDKEQIKPALAKNIDYEVCNEYIKNIENVVLSIYDIDITGEVISIAQKEFITDMYILSNFEKYSQFITFEVDKKIIENNIYSSVYKELFGEESNTTYHKKVLSEFNKEIFHIDNSEIVSNDRIGDICVVKKKYISKFLDKEFVYSVKYNLKIIENKPYLVGFVIEK